MAKTNNGIAYAILGIIAVIAIVGLVLLFNGNSATGNAVKWSSYNWNPDWYEEPAPNTYPYYNWYGARGQRAKYEIAPRRPGQMPQPYEYAAKKERKAGKSSAQQYVIGSSRR